MNNFLKINELDVYSYEKFFFITFDIDWCSDEVLDYTLKLLKKFKIKATFFITHETNLLDKMKKNKDIELGIHPNFNPLLNGDFRYGKNAQEVLKHYFSILPETISIRSHSLTHSGIFNSYYNNIKYDCNSFIPYYSNINLSPWYDTNKNILKVPHFFADDGILFQQKDMKDVKKLVYRKGLKVFDFHPIHIFLNSENLDRYDRARPHLQNFEKLKNYVNTTKYGIRDLLIDIITEGLKVD